MRITELYIENFGKLSGVRLTLQEGITSLCEPNGAGKTTLATFIKAMLYGLGDTKRMPLSENDRKHYMPWQGGRCGGSLTFLTEGGEYRIERTFAPRAADDTFALYDVRTGRPSNAYSTHVGEELFAIDADGFERTLFLSERTLEEKNENKSIAAKLSDLSGTDGDVGDLDKALALLDERRKFYHKKGGAGEIQRLTQQLASIDSRLTDMDRQDSEALALEQQLADLHTELREAEEERAAQEQLQQRQTQQEQRRLYRDSYQQRQQELAEAERHRDELCSFFSAHLPDPAELGELRRLTAEADSLSQRCAATRGSEATDGVSCDALTNAEELTKMKLAAERLMECQQRITKLRAPPDTGDTLRRLPSEEELQEQLTRLTAYQDMRRESSLPHHLLLLLGLLLLCLGGALGLTVSPLLLSLCVLGGVLMACGLIVRRSGRARVALAHAEEEALAFYREVTGQEPEPGLSPTAALVTLKRRCEDARLAARDQAQERQRLDSLRQEAEALQAELTHYFSRFPDCQGMHPLTALGHIEARLQEATRQRQQQAQHRETALREADRLTELRATLSAYFAQYPTHSDDPLTELEHRLTEYRMLENDIQRKTAQLEEFGRTHDLAPLTAEEDALRELPQQRQQLQQRLDRIKQQITVTQSRLTALQRELDGREALLSDREEAVQEHARATATLETVTQTAALLRQAADNLTARYLGKAKSAYLTYLNAIGGEALQEEDVAMDTTFSIRRSDHGQLHPTDAYSRGGRLLSALAVRLALVGALYENETPPLILDDPFLSLDDARLARAKQALARLSERHQILYLTCARDRAL